MSFNEAIKTSVKGNDYRIQFCYTTKDEAVNLPQNAGVNLFH